MKIIRVTGDDGSRVEVNAEAIVYMRRPPIGENADAPPRVEIAFAHGEKLLVRQTFDQLLLLCGCLPQRKPAAPGP